jgi:hypothetical protein
MTTSYSHAPRPVGGPVTFKLEGDRLIVDSGRKVHEVALGAVDQVRMTYEPRSFVQRAFQTRVRMRDGKTFSFSSINWKSLIEAERLDKDYRAFVRTLFDAIARANPEARFVAGRPRWIWVGTAILAAASLIAMALFTWRAMQAGATAAALMGLVLALIGIWQLEPMVRLNKPRSFTPDEPPQDLMP